MSVGVLSSRWNQVRDDLQHRWDQLSEEDLDRVKGDINQLVNLVEKKYGYTRKTAEREVNRFVKQYDRKVRDVVERVPKRVRKTIGRYPGAALVTALVLMFVAGLLLKPSR